MTVIGCLSLILHGQMSHAQTHHIYQPNIRSLQVITNEGMQQVPIIKLHGGSVSVSFDELSHEYHRYTYTVRHCDANWKQSESLFESDYLEGFASGNTIDNVQKSINTNVDYTHYNLQIPNNRCKIRMSGNYQLTIYDGDEDESNRVLTACFMVIDQLSSISMNVTANTDLGVNNRFQQVEMAVNYGDINVTDYQRQLTTYVLQNGRWDSRRTNPKPQFVTTQGLRWQHTRSLIFNGGNEYRKFECLDVNHTGLGLERITWDGNMYHAYVWTDEPRPSYVYDEDANGASILRNSDNIENEVASEYVIVHFRLKSPQLPNPVYLDANWTIPTPDVSYEMGYNQEEGLYESSILLKQGYYSYQYLTLSPDGFTEPIPSEGNFFQTENAYQGLLYFRDNGDRTDRLVGYVLTHSR